jgi:hypothetical protein
MEYAASSYSILRKENAQLQGRKPPINRTVSGRGFEGRAAGYRVAV